MIDTTAETTMLLSKAARILNPANPPHVATVWRWAMHGVRGVKLESVVIGGCRYTSREAVARFLKALNEPDAVPTPPRRGAERAERTLVAKGC